MKILAVLGAIAIAVYVWFVERRWFKLAKRWWRWAARMEARDTVKTNEAMKRREFEDDTAKEVRGIREMIRQELERQREERED